MRTAQIEAFSSSHTIPLFCFFKLKKKKRERDRPFFLLSFSQAFVSAFTMHQHSKTILCPHFYTLFVYQAQNCHFKSQYIDL